MTYLGESGLVSPETVSRAWQSYFVHLKSTAKTSADVERGSST